MKNFLKINHDTPSETDNIHSSMLEILCDYLKDTALRDTKTNHDIELLLLVFIKIDKLRLYMLIASFVHSICSVYTYFGG